MGRRGRGPPRRSITRAIDSRPSPATPPRPVGSGQRVVGGSALATALAAQKPMIQSAMRRPPSGRLRSRISRMPQRTGGSTKAREPRPRICMARSATTAPGWPRTFVGGVVGGVVEARVVDRPRGQGHGQRDRAGEEHETAEFRQALAQEGATLCRRKSRRAMRDGEASACGTGRKTGTYARG